MDEINQLGNADKILSGELVLPSEQDATHWLNRKLGRGDETKEAADQRKRIDELELKFANLQEQLRNQPPSEKTRKAFEETLKPK
jgi:hypothetical protein